MYQESSFVDLDSDFEVPTFIEAPTGELIKTLWSAAICARPVLERGEQARPSIGQRVASPRRLRPLPRAAAPLPASQRSPAPARVRAEIGTADAESARALAPRTGHFRPARTAGGCIELELRSSANVSLLRSRLHDEDSIERMAARIRARCADSDAFAIRRTDGGQWCFDLLEADGRRLASSRNFGNEALARATVKLAQLHGPQANCEPIPRSGQILQI